MFSKISSAFSHLGECVDLLLSTTYREVDEMTAEVGGDGGARKVAEALGVVIKVATTPTVALVGLSVGISKAVGDVTGSELAGNIAGGAATTAMVGGLIYGASLLGLSALVKAVISVVVIASNVLMLAGIRNGHFAQKKLEQQAAREMALDEQAAELMAAALQESPA